MPRFVALGFVQPRKKQQDIISALYFLFQIALFDLQMSGVEQQTPEAFFVSLPETET